jgi:hypothetical protein
MIDPKDSIIRVGDTVEIVRPFVFIRCSYEEGFYFHYHKMIKEIGEEIDKQLEKWGVETWRGNQAKNAIAYGRMISTPKKDGAKRVIEEVELPAIKGLTFKVDKIKRVQTGTYLRATGCEDGGNIDPAYLSHHAVHKILSKDSCFDLTIDKWGLEWSTSQIDATNCKKIT